VSNGDVELAITAAIGPRIMRFGFVGRQNLFKEFEQSLGRSGEPKMDVALWVSAVGGARGSGQDVRAG